MLQMIPILTIFSLGVMFGLMVFVIVRNYNTWLGRACLGMCITFGIWAFSIYNVMTQPMEASRVLWYQISAFGWAFYPSAIMLFAIEVSGRGNGFRRVLLFAITGIVGAVTVLLIFLHPDSFIERFQASPYGWAMTKPLHSPAMQILSAYMAIAGIVPMILLFRWSRRTKFRQEKNQAALLILAGTFVLGASTVTDLVLPILSVPTLPMTPIMSLVWFITLFYSAYRYHLLDLTPSIAAGEIMTRVRDLLLLLDRNGVVVQMNASARATLGYGMTEQQGIALKQILPVIQLPENGAVLDIETEMLTSKGECIPVQLSINPRFNDFNDLVGYILTAYDMRTRLALDLQNAERRMAEDRFEDQSRIYKLILDNVKTGFLHFGPDQKIRPEFSRQCISLFDQAELAGADFADAVLSGWDHEEKSHIRTMLESIFNEERPWRLEALMNLLPASTGGFGQLISLQYRLIDIGPEAGRRSMLVILDDRTESLRQENRLNFENARLSMVVSVLTNREAFFEFLEEYRTYFVLLRQAWKEMPAHPGEALYDLYRNIHTFKSGFARFGMKATAEHLMQIEELLSGMLKREISEADLRMVLVQCEPDAWASEDMEGLKNAIGQGFFQSRSIVETERSVLEGVASDLERQVRSSGMPQESIRTLLLRFRELYCVHAKRMLMDYEPYIQMISHERSLPEPVFAVQGSDVLLDGKLYRPFFRVLIHIFNNIIAHAIETPEERIAKAKPERSRIECHVELRNGNMVIEIADDGRGIEPARIREEMRARTGLTAPEIARIPDQEILQRIFEPGYSSTLVADSLSGRGIGLFAVAHATRQIGGTVRVSSRAGAFTRFSFILPIRQLQAAERREP